MENSIENLLKYGINELEKANIEDAKVKVQILLMHIINKPKQYLIINKNEIIEEALLKQYKQGIEKLKQNIPVQYITNTQEFMGLKFYVDENVLIPRFDTEILVEEVIKICKDTPNLKVLDVCTGSGAIAICLQKLLNNSTVYAIDISQKALNVAKKNNQTNKTKVSFIQSNMFENIGGNEFDIIVSNPPYIETNTIKQLSDDVKKEPALALDGGADGLKFYKILADQAHKYLKINGLLAMEIGYNQKESVMQILEETQNYKEIYCKKDLNGNNRIIICKKK